MLSMSSNVHSKDDKGTEERNGRARNRFGLQMFQYENILQYLGFFGLLFSFHLNFILSKANLVVLNKMV